MTILWSAFDTELDYILKDSTYTQYPLAFRMAAYNWAILNLMNFEPKQKTATLTSGAMSYALPSDFYEIVAVWDGASWCQGIDFTSDSWTSMPNPITGNLSYERAFWIFANNIGFTKALTVNGTLYYHGQYTEAVATNTALDIPIQTKQAMIYWTVAGCLNPKLVQQGKVAIWGKTNQPGLTSKSMPETYEFYWNEGVKLLQQITHKPSEMTLIAKSRRTQIK